MKVLELREVTREEGEIFYRRHFKGLAVIEFPLRTENIPIDFIIETSPLGSKQIDITLTKKIDYPLLPVQKALRELIKQKDFEGNLPL